MDPTLEAQLMAYFNSEPAFANEYARIRANGEQRSAAEWMYDHITASPGDMEKFRAMAESPTTAAGTEAAPVTTTMPLEQDLLNTALPGLLSDVEGDAARRALAAQLAGQATGATQQAISALSPEENAARLLAEYAQADATGGRIAESAATSAADQLKALQASIAAMQGNLTGDLAARAAALQQQIATLTANLDTLDASQKATLATQIAANQQNLEQQITAQRTALTEQMNALRGAADAQSQARAAALQQEVDALTAAQAPLAKARLDSAGALATAVNQGLQSTADQLTATRAKQGYLGSSSFDDAALARASIDARQKAAQAMGGARELNAQDLASIGVHGATEGRSIADQLAAARAGIATEEAGGARTLADLLATGTRTIGDTGAAGIAGISGQTATGKFNVGNAGAGQTFQDQVFGADQQRELADALARGSGTIGTTLATQQQAARDAATGARQNYFDNAYTRGLAGLMAIPGLTSGLTGNLTSLENYGTSGLGRAQQALNWWAAPATAPTTQATAVQADNSGNQISTLGSGLLSSAISLGNSKNWWQTPTTNKTTGGISDTGSLGW